jgi:hypothetical protein
LSGYHYSHPLSVAGLTYALSPRHHVKELSSESYRLLAHTLCVRYPLMPIHCRYDQPRIAHSMPLNTTATFFDYVIVDGKRFCALRSVGTNHSSLARVAILGANGHGSELDAWGEILEVLQIEQNFHDKQRVLWFAWMRWFRPLRQCGDNLWTKL